MSSSLGNTQLLVGRASGYSSLNTADISGNLLVTNGLSVSAGTVSFPAATVSTAALTGTLATIGSTAISAGVTTTTVAGLTLTSPTLSGTSILTSNTAYNNVKLYVSSPPNVLAYQYYPNSIGNAYYDGTNWNLTSDGINRSFSNTVYGWQGQYMLAGTLSGTTPSTISDATMQSYIRMSILNSGNVGIGTTAPSYKLDVAGLINSNAGGVSFTANNATYSQYGTASAYPTNRFNTIAAGDGVNAIINADGTKYVAGQGLILTGQSLYWGAQTPTAPTSFASQIQIDGGRSAPIGTTNHGQIRFYTSNAQQMTINELGNVGIGTTNPQYPLDVTGSVNSTGQYNYIGHNSGPPAGAISAYLGTTDPDGWIICDGVQRTNGSDGRYNRLITAGIGSGTANSTYTPPNLKGQFLYGSSTTSSVNGTGGASSVTLTTANLPAHNHTATDSGHTHANTLTDPGHVHQQNSSDDGGRSDGTTAQSNNTYTQTGFNTNSATTGITITNASATANITIGNTGSGTSFSILPTYTTVNYIIKY